MRFCLLGLPPSTNNLYTVVRGRQVLSESGIHYHESVAAVMRRLWGKAPSDAPFAVLITYHLRYDRDVDGSQKVILDGFAPRAKGGGRDPVVWGDDRQLILFAARKERLPAGVLPYVSVVVRELRGKPAYSHPDAIALRGDRRRLDFRLNLIPPSNNNAYVPVGKGRIGRVKSAAARTATAEYSAGFSLLVDGLRSQARQMAVSSPDARVRAAAAAVATSNPLFPKAVRLRLRFGYTADRRDVDGSSKIILDAGASVLWANDSQIISYSVTKARVADGAPLVEGGVWEIGRPQKP